MMFSHTFRYTVLIGLFMTLFILSGCASYGKVTPGSGENKTVSIDDLVKDLDSYHVYYSGMDVDNLAGILFDPKGDAKTLTPTDRWVRMEDPETVERATKWLKTQYRRPGHYPYMRSILGPDGSFYGYLFSVWHHVTVRVENEDTLVVYDLPNPPHYFGPAAGIRENL